MNVRFLAWKIGDRLMRLLLLAVGVGLVAVLVAAVTMVAGLLE